MFGRTLNLLDLVAAAAVFGFAVMCILGLIILWQRRRRQQWEALEQRLGSVESETGQKRMLLLWHEGRAATTVVPAVSPWDRWGRRVSQFVREAGYQSPPQALLLMTGITAMAAAVVAYALQSVPLGLAAGGAIPFVLWMIAQRRVDRLAAAFERQLVDALQLAARSLRAGHPLLGAFRLISEEMQAPIGTVFLEICQQQQLGVSLDTALRRASAQSSSLDLKLFATCVTIQLRSGGNLADMMEQIGEVIRERIRLARRVRVLTAQTQFSKRILLLMPVLVFVVLNIIRPSYMKTLYGTETGRILLAIAAAGLTVGALVMNRMARIKG